jgi:hypothetical protein
MTSALLFRMNQPQAFNLETYGTSSQWSSGTQQTYFDWFEGFQSGGSKTTMYVQRAIRRIPVIA